MVCSSVTLCSFMGMVLIWVASVKIFWKAFMTAFSKSTKILVGLLLGIFSLTAMSKRSYVFSRLFGSRAYMHGGLYPLMDVWMVKSWKKISGQSLKVPSASHRCWVDSNSSTSVCWPKIKSRSGSSVPESYIRKSLNSSGTSNFLVWGKTGKSFMLFFWRWRLSVRVIRVFLGIDNWTHKFSETLAKLVAIASVLPVYSEVSFMAATIFAGFCFSGNISTAVFFRKLNDGISAGDNSRFTAKLFYIPANPMNSCFGWLFFRILEAIIN